MSDKANNNLTQPEITAEMLRFLRDIDEKLSALGTELSLHVAKDEQRDENISRLNNVVFGDGKEESLPEQVRKNTEFRQRTNRALWFVIIPLLSTLGLAMVKLIQLP